MTKKNASGHAHIPASGPWHGNFAYAYDLATLLTTSCTLEFDGPAIRGAGADLDGEFTIVGGWDAASGVVRWQKRYTASGGARVAYVGSLHAESGELRGRWRVIDTSTHGRFTLRPGAASGADLSGENPEASAFLKRRAKEWQSLCKVDLEALRFDGERSVLDHLLRDPDYVRAMKTMQDERDEATAVEGAQRLSVRRVRLRRSMVPGLFALLDRCVAVLGLSAPVELYVTNDGAMNASVGSRRDKTIDIEFTSATINQLESAELLYVLGHELGHALLGHLETPRVDEGQTTGLTALRSYALQRYEEISADRVGMLCCDDVGAALRAEFVLTTGITSRAALGDVRAFVEHSRAAIDKLEAGVASMEEGFDTHPYGELRAIAIDLFGRSETFAKLLGRKGGEVSEAQMERQVARLLKLMNPSVMERGLKDLDVVEFMILASRAVAEVSGGVNAAEKKILRKVAKGHEELRDRVDAMSFEERQLRVVDLAEVLSASLQPLDRMGLLQDLTVIARSDGRVSPREKRLLDELGQLIGVASESVDESLNAIDGGLD